MQLTIPAERASSLRVWILIPAAGDLIHATFSTNLITLLGLLRTHGIWYRLHYLPGDSLVTRARNNLADIFYSASSDDDTDLCLWLDCDILFQPESVLQMLALNLDFVAAPYSKKGLHVDRMKAAVEESWSNDRIMAVVGSPNVNWLVHPITCAEPMPVLESGSGFWLTKRRVYRLMVENLAHIRYRRSHEETAHYGRDYAHDFFRVGVWPDTQEYLSEDWWFCREWRKLGGLVHCCFWIKTNHIGPYMYPMDMPAISDLLTTTGGYINAETRPNMETKNASTPVRQGTISSLHGGNGADLDKAIRALRDVRQATQGSANEATSESGPGPMGD